VNIDLAFVGDIHGNLEAATGLWNELNVRDAPHVVFLGDYINKGPRTAEVLAQVIEWQATGRATLLAGNHELALVDALDREDLSAFLKMGGAATIRSYLKRRIGPDVLGDFLARIPVEHLSALRRMPQTFETPDLVAQHVPSSSAVPKFRISAHTPVGDVPRIDARSAHIDTGCGAGQGRLTALLWPTLAYVQVDAQGSVLTPGADPFA
jgi:serine/threonine protein phosphatase 1